MATVSWKNDANGNWNTPSNWSSGAVPGPSADVVISTPTPRVITFGGGNDTILSLSMSDGTLMMTGGSLSIRGDTSVSGAFNETGAKAVLVLGGLQSQFTGPVTQTAGTIDVASGVMILFGTGNILGGTITGTTLDVAGGSDTLRGGLKLATREVMVGGGTLTLGGNLAYAGTWAQTSGELDVAGHTLRLSKLTEISSGLVVGPGTLVVSGSAQISNTTMSNGVVLQNTGSIGISGELSLQASSSATPGVINEAGGTLNLAGGADVFGSAGVVLNNAGTLEQTAGGGTSLVQVATINSGKVVIGSGKMEFLAPVTGTGTFSVGTGSSLEFSASVASGSTVSMGASAALLVDPLTTSGGFAATIAGFAHGDAIEAMSFAYSATSLSFNSTRDILTLSEGSFKGSLHFTGSYHASDFFLFSDNGTAAIGHV